MYEADGGFAIGNPIDERAQRDLHLESADPDPDAVPDAEAGGEVALELVIVDRSVLSAGAGKQARIAHPRRSIGSASPRAHIIG